MEGISVRSSECPCNGGVGMEQYLEKLLSQIRCKKARPYIAEEIRGHMESQIEDNMAHGMTYEEAEKNAVADMGDPITAGISLDKIHKPQFAWKLLIIVGILSLLGILLQQSILYQSGYHNLEPYMQEIYRLESEGFAYSVLYGFIFMCGIYFVDYTVIAKYSKIIGLFIISMGILLLAGFFGGVINGSRYSIGFGMFRISAVSLMMFYVPVYGAILYKYRDGGPAALFKAIVWLIVPVFITFRIPSLVGAMIMLISMLVQLTAAILKGWFHVPVKKTLAGLWSIFLILPAIALVGMYLFHWLAEYQEERIRAFLTGSGDGFYLTSVLRALNKGILPVGNSGNDVFGSLPEFNSDYIFAYILNSYGSIAGVLVIAVLTVLVMFIFGAAIKQKNELGMVMGFGCGMLLLLNIVANISGALGLVPPAASFLPFLSVGKSNILLCYGLVGMILSIYRYKDVYPKKIRASQIVLQKKFTINM